MPHFLRGRTRLFVKIPNICQYLLCFACLRTSDAPDAAHVPARGIQGVWELVHTLGGLEHPEITRDYAGVSLWVVDSTFVVMGGRTKRSPNAQGR